MSKNERLIGAAQKAIDDLFSDESVSQKQAVENLRDIIEDCKIKIDSLELDNVD